MTLAPCDNGKTACIVTGFSSGIGRVTAEMLAERHDTHVIGLDVDSEAADELVTSLQARGFKANAIQCDVSDERAVLAAFSGIDSLGVTPTRLVNNAARPVERQYPEDLSLESWSATLETNLTGYFLTAREFGRRVISDGRAGVIVNVSSINSQKAMGRGNLAYSVSKAGVDALTRELAIEWAQKSIRVNSVLPCQTKTKKLVELLQHTDIDSNQVGRTALAGIPMARYGEPSEIASAICFLLSDEASLITGVSLPVDGGNLALNPAGSIQW